jgi:hypothetical protein
MTKQERDELRKLVPEALAMEDDGAIGVCLNAVPALLDEVARLRALLREVEWASLTMSMGVRTRRGVEGVMPSSFTRWAALRVNGWGKLHEVLSVFAGS